MSSRHDSICDHAGHVPNNPDIARRFADYRTARRPSQRLSFWNSPTIAKLYIGVSYADSQSLTVSSILHPILDKHLIKDHR